MLAVALTSALTRRSAVAGLAGLGLIALTSLPVAFARAGALSEEFVSPVGSTVEPTVPMTVVADRVEGEFYSFDIPEYWRGRVTIEVKGASAFVHPACCPRLELLSVHVRDAGREPLPLPGNPDHEYVYGVDNGRGQYVYVDVYNFAMWAFGEYRGEHYAASWGLEDVSAVLGELVDLSTGGAVTSEQARGDYGEVHTASYDFCREAFLPGFEVCMDEGWARLAALEVSDWEPETLCAFAERASLELADASGGLSWVFDLARDPQVVEWAGCTLPVARFLVDVVEPLLSLPDPADFVARASFERGNERRGWFAYELSYTVQDAQVATLAGYVGALWHGGGVGSLVYGIDRGDPALLEEASARALVVAELDSMLAAQDLSGASYGIDWACRFPAGVEVSGSTFYSDGLVTHGFC